VKEGGGKQTPKGVKDCTIPIPADGNKCHMQPSSALTGQLSEVSALCAPSTEGKCNLIPDHRGYRENSYFAKPRPCLSPSKRQTLAVGLQLSMFEWNLAILLGHIVQFAGDGICNIAELLFLLFVVLGRSGRRAFR
jgi:hypothetical protein